MGKAINEPRTLALTLWSRLISGETLDEVDRKRLADLLQQDSSLRDEIEADATLNALLRFMTDVRQTSAGHLLLRSGVGFSGLWPGKPMRVRGSCIHCLPRLFSFGPLIDVRCLASRRLSSGVLRNTLNPINSPRNNTAPTSTTIQAMRNVVPFRTIGASQITRVTPTTSIPMATARRLNRRRGLIGHSSSCCACMAFRFSRICSFPTASFRSRSHASVGSTTITKTRTLARSRVDNSVAKTSERPPTAQAMQTIEKTVLFIELKSPLTFWKCTCSLWQVVRRLWSRFLDVAA